MFLKKKINHLIGYTSEVDNEISDQSILNFHLSHRTNPDFSYTPSEKTSKIIWKYLSSSNLLEQVDLVDLENVEKIKFIEKATNDKNYKLLQTYEGRALLYQRLLLTTNIEDKLDLCSKLKESFVSDGFENIFSVELSKILKQIEYVDVPSNYSTFYNSNLIADQNKQKKIKYNNKIIHQSKLINYLLG